MEGKGANAYDDDYDDDDGWKMGQITHPHPSSPLVDSECAFGDASGEDVECRGDQALGRTNAAFFESGQKPLSS